MEGMYQGNVPRGTYTLKPWKKKGTGVLILTFIHGLYHRTWEFGINGAFNNGQVIKRRIIKIHGKCCR